MENNDNIKSVSSILLVFNLITSIINYLSCLTNHSSPRLTETVPLNIFSLIKFASVFPLNPNAIPISILFASPNGNENPKCAIICEMFGGIDVSARMGAQCQRGQVD